MTESWDDRCTAAELVLGRELTALEAADLAVDLAAGDSTAVESGVWRVIDG